MDLREWDFYPYKVLNIWPKESFASPTIRTLDVNFVWRGYLVVATDLSRIWLPPGYHTFHKEHSMTKQKVGHQLITHLSALISIHKHFLSRVLGEPRIKQQLPSSWFQASPWVSTLFHQPNGFQDVRQAVWVGHFTVMTPPSLGYCLATKE